jgi:hypothetical protein
MEEIDARDDLTWTSFDYRLVVRDMAQLHAKYWGRTDFLTYDWLWRPDREALHLHMAGLAEVAEGVSGSWLEGTLPEMFGRGKLSLMRRVLSQYPRMVRPLNAPGLTLCHGDYWFHNVLLTRAGARVLIDWQGSRIWSGIWELAYFLNLLLAVSPGVYREMPVPEESVVRWYVQGLEAAGVSIPESDFNRAFLAARVLHPLLHWLPMVGASAASPPYDIDEPTRRFLAQTFERWERDATSLMQ